MRTRRRQARRSRATQPAQLGTPRPGDTRAYGDDYARRVIARGEARKRRRARAKR